ncbi:hypothetical protein ACFQ0G_10835 [Streptomyces chiangmaiensis]
MALAKATAEHIERELTTLTGLREFALFQEYLRACQHSRGIVFALNNDVVMMNDHARQVLTASDQAALLATAAEAMMGSKRVVIDVDLPSGAKARMSCAPVHTASGPAGGVVRVRLTGTGPGLESDTSAFQPLLPGLAGSSAVWQRACDQVRAHYLAGEWITVQERPAPASSPCCALCTAIMTPRVASTCWTPPRRSTPPPSAPACSRNSGRAAAHWCCGTSISCHPRASGPSPISCTSGTRPRTGPESACG